MSGFLGLFAFQENSEATFYHLMYAFKLNHRTLKTMARRRKYWCPIALLNGIEIPRNFNFDWRELSKKAEYFDQMLRLRLD